MRVSHLQRALLAALAVTSWGLQADEVVDLTPAASTDQIDHSPVNETSGMWFVEFNNAPLADGGDATLLRQDKAQFRNDAKRAKANFSERYSYDNLFNGMSIRASALDVAKLKQLSNVKAVYAVDTIPMPTTSPMEDPNMATAIAMTGADIAQNELGYTGKGVRVAVMDTGVDYHHPDLGNCFGSGCKVYTGYDLVGDAFNADSSSASYNPVATPDNDPDDCGGHGTHVAGIIGASGRVKGVAPEVSIGAYRVFGCQGSTTADIMLAAMERVAADGMQVLNMSIGSSFQWPQYPTAKAATRLVNKGVVVVASIGNSGSSGLYAAGAPGVGDKVIGVASFDNTGITLPVFHATPDDRSFAFTSATGAPVAPNTGSFPMKRTGTSTSVADACSALPAGSLSGSIALIRRGTCSFYIKANNARNAGAAGVVLYNNAAGMITPTVVGAPAINVPVVAISMADGAVLDGRIAAGPVSMRWSSDLGSTPNATGNLISTFSSFGMSADLQLKPDLGAPGGSIYATYPLEKGGYASLSGTSMASPHVAGAVALLLQAKPNTPSQAVRTLLQNSADPKNWAGNPGLGFLDNVHRQGAGMLDIDDTILATAKVEPAKLSLGESQAGPATHTLTVSNDSDADVTYDLSHISALATGPNSFSVQYLLAPATAAFSAATVTVPAHGSATFEVTITANAALANASQYGGYVVLTPQGGGAPMRVPYAGLKGDYQAIAVLTPTANGFPWLAKLNGTSYQKQATGGTFSMVGNDVPFFLLHFDHFARRLRMEVLDAVTGKNWHRAADEQYLPRASSANGFISVAWNGETKAGKQAYVVPNGQYTVKVSALKALGDETNPADWETWTSPTITVARP